MSIEKIKKGISAYFYEQKVILRILRKHKKLSEFDFDRIFGNTPKKLRGYPMKGDSYILAGLSLNPRDWWLELLQCMIRINLIDAETINGEVIYSTI